MSGTRVISLVTGASRKVLVINYVGRRDPSDGRLQSEAKVNTVSEQQRQNLDPELISDPMPLLLRFVCFTKK